MSMGKPKSTEIVAGLGRKHRDLYPDPGGTAGLPRLEESREARASARTATVNVVFPKALIREMDAYAAAFMKEHPGMVLRRSDVVRIAVQEMMRAKGQGK